MKFKVLFLWAVFSPLCLTAFAEDKSDFGQLFVQVMAENSKPIEISFVQLRIKTAEGGKGYSFATKPAEKPGVYKIENIPTGKYHAIKIDKNGFAPFWEYDIEVLQNTQDIIFCQLSKGCTLKGIVEDQNGIPLPDISVVINSPLCRRDVITDASGHFVAEHLYQTNYSVIAEPPSTSPYKICAHKGLVSCGSADVKIVLKRKEKTKSINEYSSAQRKDIGSNNHTKLASASLRSRKIAEETLLNKPAPPLVIEKWHPMGFWNLNLKNKVVLIDFWGVWCRPCVREIPFLQYLHEKYSAKGVLIIGVHTPDKKELVQEFMTKNNMSYLVGIDCGDKTAELYHVSGYPIIYIVDQRGYIRAVDPKKKEIEKLLISLLGNSSNRSSKQDKNDSSHAINDR